MGRHLPSPNESRNLLNWTELDDATVKTLKALAADAVERVGNGHPGTAISLAPVAHLLFQKVMRHDPTATDWMGRDRFILSAGHSSLTLYLQLFLGGFGLELEDIKSLRTWGSKTPGHPEYGHTAGVEITTGPLGQGLAAATGFAMSTRFERNLFDPAAAPGESVFDHMVYVVAGDGDLQEGVSAEAASLAGHLALGNLVVIYDANQISIEDDTNISFTEDVNARYRSYGWHTQDVDWVGSGDYREDVQALYSAIEAARLETSKPSLIRLRTIIGWPAPSKQNTGKIHGSKLGEEELRGLKQALGFDPQVNFAVPDAVLQHTRQLVQRGQAMHRDWQQRFDSWSANNPEASALLDRLVRQQLPNDIEQYLPKFESTTEIATRAAFGKVLNAVAGALPELWGGSADLAESNNTTIEGAGSFVPDCWVTKAWKPSPHGRVLHFGVREHAMGAILNGISLSGVSRVFGGTFLIFSDYMRPAVRLAALMGIDPIYIWTHDSIALGEDGPTHQPVEHLAALRAIPGLCIVRPADANEVASTWLEILSRRSAPSGFVLSRQNLRVFDRDGSGADSFAPANQARLGAYVLQEARSGSPEVILIATGSEVQLAVSAREQLESSGIATRVVSAPCLEWFAEQSNEYIESVLPHSVKARVSVEAGLALGWERWIGSQGESVSVETYGASADHVTLYEKYGLTVAAVVDAAKAALEGRRK